MRSLATHRISTTHPVHSAHKQTPHRIRGLENTAGEPFPSRAGVKALPLSESSKA